jgi:osmotically-inducible protein OsmY
MSTTGDIRAAVYEQLAADPRIESNDIEVDLLQDSVVLNGTVPAQYQVSEATAAAKRVPGVAGVQNLLDVALPSDDYGDDAALARLANGALAADKGVPANVVATADAGCIFLTGTVRESAQRAVAENAVADVAGVLSITNEIDVSGDEG